jgi:tRNA(fMet)-specific endonuclease VapC
MAARFLLDTNIFIYIRRRRPLEVRRRFEAFDFGETAMSVITYGELMFGVERSGTRSKSLAEVEEITALIPILPLPAAAAPIYGSIRAALALKGQIIGANDMWIAAHAIAQDLTVVTNNEREFRRVSGLKVENWATS